MKRVLPLLLIACLLAGLHAAAAEETPEESAGSLAVSQYAPAASYSQLQWLFSQAQTQAGSSLSTRGSIAGILWLHSGEAAQDYTGAGRPLRAGVALMAEPDENSAVLRRLGKSNLLTVTGLADGWYAVTTDALTGYIPQDSARIYCQGLEDVPYGAWYAQGALWAAGADIIPAESGAFSPEQPLTREELCLALVRYMQYLGQTLPEINETYYFTDEAQFTPQGLAAAKTLQRAGILCEFDDGSFRPGATVSLSEAEGILLRFFQNLQEPFSFRGVPVSTVDESQPVDDSWFDDACFIGHSQVVGMAKYFGLENADFYAVVGFNVQNVLDFEYFERPTGRMGTLEEALGDESYEKVYIMLGINDCSTREDRIETFLASMRELLDLVKEQQPKAKVYLLSLAPVGRETPNNLCYNLDNVILYSQAVKLLSREYGAEYLDVFRLMADGEGYLLGEYDAGDGIHIQAARYENILEFLRCHI